MRGALCLWFTDGAVYEMGTVSQREEHHTKDTRNKQTLKWLQ